MSSSIDPDEEAAAAIEERLDLYERIAHGDLPISDDIQRILELANIGDGSDD